VRRDGRAPGELREVYIQPGFMSSASGSALIEMGGTRVICTASVEEEVPRWMRGKGRGWVTAEYGMLPASTGRRKQRDVSKGRPDGRTVEIQRLIGRALRGVVDFERLGERTVWVDGVPREVGPVRFSEGLDRIDGENATELWFESEAVRERRDRLPFFQSDYRQPFGSFRGTLPGDVPLAAGLGVTERHLARW